MKRVPVSLLFCTSAVCHYLGPSLAVLLFAHLDVFTVVWLRIAGAAAVFAVWRRPWTSLTAGQWRHLFAMGAVLAVMNTVFYLAIDRLPLSTVGAIEFLGVIGLAAVGVRTRRNALALVLAVGGVLVLTDLRLVGEPLGFVFAFANCALFVLYVVLGHRIANAGSGIDKLGGAMLVAAVLSAPLGMRGAATVFAHPVLLPAGIGVGLLSSVIPYALDQLAMARLRRATFALMLCILPAAATVLGLLVLAQLPTVPDLVGVGLVIAGIGIHQQRTEREETACATHDSAERA